MALEIPAGDGLDGKVAIVTGAGARDEGIGNGRAAAILLAASGAPRTLCRPRCRVGGTHRRDDRGSRRRGPRLCRGTVTRTADCEAMVAAAVGRWRRLDILDNNVGIGSRGNVVEEDPERWRRVMEVNVVQHVPGEPGGDTGVA